MEQRTLLVGESAEVVEARRVAKRAACEAAADHADPRVVEADRSQIELRPLDLDSLIPLGHRARIIWSFVEKLDLRRFYGPIKARGSRAGRPCTDPKILLTLWLYAYSEGIGSAHVVDKLCGEHDAYRWICGGVTMNYHTLSDFRSEHGAAFDDLLTQSLAVMAHAGLISFKRVAQDGTRVRTSAGAGSFRRRARLKDLLKAAREQVEAVKQQADVAVDTQRNARQKAAQERAARERAERVERALLELARMEQQREQEKGGHQAKGEPRASTTDPEARKMKMADGGFRPAYNAQIASDTESRVIVGVDITEDGTDYAQSEPMLEQIEARTGKKPEELLVDGGYISKGAVERIAEESVTLYGPVPERKANPDRFTIKPNDSAAIAQWKRRMASTEGQEIYHQRGATIETINADLKTWRALDRFLVRGKRKVLCVLILNALTYNILRWAVLAAGT